RCLPRRPTRSPYTALVRSTQDREIGGGRIIGEACHFIDLLRYLAGAPIVTWHVQPMASNTGDTASISLSFADGSTGTVHYFANGDRKSTRLNSSHVKISYA